MTKCIWPRQQHCLRYALDWKEMGLRCLELADWSWKPMLMCVCVFVSAHAALCLSPFTLSRLCMPCWFLQLFLVCQPIRFEAAFVSRLLRLLPWAGFSLLYPLFLAQDPFARWTQPIVTNITWRWTRYTKQIQEITRRCIPLNVSEVS